MPRANPPPPSITSIEWRFPPTGGGREDGFNDPGMAHFAGSPLRSLAREIVQNSLDARANKEQPVYVSFEIKKLAPGGNFSHQLAKHIDACITRDTDVNHRKVLEKAKSLLSSRHSRLPFLCVSDKNTTGLREKQWHALVKEQGTSIKDDQGSGGSFGIGKYAPFAVSPLRTVCYWTYYTVESGPVEKFQAKSVLMSHDFEIDGSLQRTQGTGFFGNPTGCQEVNGTAIPTGFRILSSEGNPIAGTAIWIAGVPEHQFSSSEIAQSVIENFFLAIDRDHLRIVLEPEDSSNEHDLEIQSESLGHWFDKLLKGKEASDIDDEDDAALRDARIFRDLMFKSRPTETLDDSDLGLCKLWINVQEGLPNRVGLIRQTGMLITTRQQGLIRFAGLQDFAAVCVFDDPKGNMFLRQMENPQHNGFEPDRLPREQVARGKSALKRVTQWIRDKVKQYASLKISEAPEELVELSSYFPDFEAPSPFSGQSQGTEREQAFGATGEIKYKQPKRRIRPTTLPLELPDSNDGAGDGPGDGPRPRQGTRTHDGPNEEASGSGSQAQSIVELRDVRIVPGRESSERSRLYFTPSQTGAIRLELSEAGDSSAIPRPDLELFETADGKDPLPRKRIRVEQDKRQELWISGGHRSIADIAWSICGIAEEREESK